MPAITLWIMQVWGLCLLIWYTSFQYMLSAEFAATSLDSDPATVVPPVSNLPPSPTPVSIITGDAYLSCSDGFHEKDRVILVSRLGRPAQTIRLGRCVKSNMISGIGHVIRLGRIYGK
ncbi:hypothetical protein ARMGADRAFT_1090447 [Armillaria gallica]|uniref:Uncharacterized protein n=1 Tax=Armillaria gallica TaxID=47427 RepID=A0A2H3CKK3_ARMGA|nr:hypothetical protein ARMGADRAFT_1090447 [Armillaria gallica]